MKKMSKFLQTLIVAAIGFLFGVPLIALAAAFLVPQGGTGATTFLQGLIYSPGGTSALQATSSGLTIDHVYATSTTATSSFAAGVQATRLNITSTTASSTFANGIQLSKGCFQMPNGSCLTQGGAGTVTNIATTWPITGGPITNTGTLVWDGFASSTPWTQGGVVTLGANQKTLFTSATTTLSGSGVITVTAGASVLGASPITVSCPTCGTGNGTVTQIAFGDGLNGGTITTSGNVNLKSYFATSTADTIGSIMYSGSTNGWPAKVAYVATSSQTLSSAFSTTGTVGNFVGGTSGTLSSVIQPSFTWFATSTSFIGTTTIPLQVNLPLAETINRVSCRAYNGASPTFLNVQLGYGTASTSMIIASSTVGTINFSANNTPGAGANVSVDIGTTTAITVTPPLYLNCTYKITI